jgi:hypothetical protein
MPPGARPERAILKMAQRTLRPDLRWGLGRLPVSGPKPDQHEQQNAGTQADNMGGSKIAVGPGYPRNDRHDRQNDHHAC